MKRLIFNADVTLCGTNWSYFGKIITLSILEENNDVYYKKVKIINEKDDIEKILDIFIEYFYNILETHDIYCFGGLQKIFNRFSHLSGFYSILEDVALNCYDIEYSIYKHLGYYPSLLNFSSLEYNIFNDERLTIEYNRNNIEKLKENAEKELLIILNIIKEYESNKFITWKNKDGKFKSTKPGFELKKVKELIGIPFDTDISWLGSKLKNEEDFFIWMKEE